NTACEYPAAADVTHAGHVVFECFTGTRELGDGQFEFANGSIMRLTLDRSAVADDLLIAINDTATFALDPAQGKFFSVADSVFGDMTVIDVATGTKRLHADLFVHKLFQALK